LNCHLKLCTLAHHIFSIVIIQYCQYSYYHLVPENCRIRDLIWTVFNKDRNCPIWIKIGQFVSANEVKLLTFRRLSKATQTFRRSAERFRKFPKTLVFYSKLREGVNQTTRRGQLQWLCSAAVCTESFRGNRSHFETTKGQTTTAFFHVPLKERDVSDRQKSGIVYKINCTQ